MRNALYAIMLIALCAPALNASVPPTMNYQGILTTAAGIPVPDGAYDVTFAIYNSPTSALVRWTETQTLTTVDGLFNTVLGSVIPIPDTAVMDTAAYLEIAVETDPPLSPRTKLTSNAFSIVSSAVLGEGPILIEHEDVASGTQSSFSLDVKPEGGTGKNIRKNITITLPSSNESVELEEIVGLSGTAKSAVAIPAFMKNARKAKTAEAAESRESLDIDSGYVHSISIELPGDTLQMLDIASATGTSAAVAIPAFMKNARKAKTAEATTSREILDIDSGYAKIVTFTTLTDTMESIESINPSGGSTKAAVAIPAFMKNARKAKTAEAVSMREILDTDSGYAEVAKLEYPNLKSTVEHGARQTKEHVLLARQVGGTSSQSHRSLELQTNDDEVGAMWHFANPADDSSEIDVAIDDIEQRITLATKLVGGTKWKNIVLKRGLAATEMTLSHVAAGPSNVIQARVDAAGGARLGINTATPTLGFQLVGSGCYTGTFGVCSDERYKENITTLVDPIQSVDRLRGVSFEWKRSEFPDHNFPEGEQVGLIAQEVEKVVPGAVNTDSKGYKSVDYAKLVPLLIEAVKEQQRQIEELKQLVTQ